MKNLSSMRLLAASAMTVLTLASPARAADPMVEGARLCTQQFPVQEMRKGIPTHLLAAISSTESGRWHDKLGLALPWPWTINVEGKGYYFDTKAEAVAQTAAYMKQGKRSIDVGCMQVNLKHHAGAFKNLDEAFEPATNVAYAADFLRRNYDDLGDWIKATAAYHSRTDYYGRQYLTRIEKSWNRIVAKVQQARERQGITTAMAANPNFDMPPAAANSRMRPLDSTRSVRVISVSDSPTAKNEVMVVKTSETLNAPVRVAETVPAPTSDMMVKATGTENIRRVTIDSKGQSSNSGGDSPTRFVFAN